MTRKEWMLENHPDLVGDNFMMDPSTADLDSIGCRQDCTTCWNQEIPDTLKKENNHDAS